MRLSLTLENPKVILQWASGCTEQTTIRKEINQRVFRSNENLVSEFVIHIDIHIDCQSWRCHVKFWRKIKEFMQSMQFIWTLSSYLRNQSSFEGLSQDFCLASKKVTYFVIHLMNSLRPFSLYQATYDQHSRWNDYHRTNQNPVSGRSIRQRFYHTVHLRILHLTFPKYVALQKQLLQC